MQNRRSLLKTALGAVGMAPFLNLGSAKAKDGLGAYPPYFEYPNSSPDVITLDPSPLYPEVMRSFNIVPREERCGWSLYPMKNVKTGEDWGEVALSVFSVANSIEYKSYYGYSGEYYSRPQVVERARQMLFAGLTKKIKDDIFHTLLAAGADRNIICANHISPSRVNYCSPESIESWQQNKSMFGNLPSNIVEDFEFGDEYDKYLVNNLHYDGFFSKRRKNSARHFGVSVNLDPESTIFIQPDWGKPKVSTNVLMEYDEDFNFTATPFKKDGYETLQVIMVYGVAVLDTEEVTLLSLRTT